MHPSNAVGPMTTETPSRPVPARPDFDARGIRPFAIFTGLTVLSIFVQSITAGKFIQDGVPDSAKQIWTDVHGLMAYPIPVFSLIAAITALRSLGRASRARILAPVLFVATVAQWLTAHAISELGLDWVTPFHVALAFVNYGLAVWLSVQSAMLRRQSV